MEDFVYVLAIADNSGGAGIDYDVKVFGSLDSAKLGLDELKYEFLESINIEDWDITDETDNELPRFSACGYDYDNDYSYALAIYQREII